MQSAIRSIYIIFILWLDYQFLLVADKVYSWPDLQFNCFGPLKGEERSGHIFWAEYVSQVLADLKVRFKIR